MSAFGDVGRPAAGARDADGRVEAVSDASWRSFSSSPIAVLVLTESGCPACAAWLATLGARLRSGAWPDVRFGKIALDRPDARGFVEANTGWLDRVEGVPFNVVYVDGEPRASFVGGGLERLQARLERHAPWSADAGGTARAT